LPRFTLAWIGNRGIQSLGWPGLVKVSSRWFRFDRYGAIMGILSLSYLFGDAASRWFMGLLIENGLGWRGVYYVAAGVMAALLVANILFLRNAPGEVGLSEPVASPEEAIRERQTGDAIAEGTLLQPERGIGQYVLPLLRSPAFYFVCVMSFGFTIVRETFNDWTPTFYHEALGMGEGLAAKLSALFPLLGGISVLIAGFGSDRLGRLGRPAIILGGLIFSTVFLALLGVLPFQVGAGATAIVVLVALVGLVMIGPYSYLAGAVALDFGGKKSSASAAGIIDGVGYLGGVLAGKTIAELSVRYGWHGAFLALAATAAASTVVAFFYLLAQRNRLRAAATVALANLTA
jgi:OPA family glycerol-3-phosphate transporter-like MFS transporter